MKKIKKEEFKMKKAIACGLALLTCFAICACESTSTPQGNVTYTSSDKKLAQEIRSAEKDKVITLTESEDTSLISVNESNDSSKVANEKFELDITANVTGNVYDPDDVNIYGEFVSPSGEIYEMPAYFYRAYERSFEAMDESLEYLMGGDYVEQGSVSLKGLLDEIDGVKTPVAKATFHSASGSYSNAGAILSTGSVTRLHDSVSVWLKKDENFTADKLYLGFYQSAGEAYVELPELTTEWQRYIFRWSDFIANNTDGSDDLLDLSTMYSGYVQTRGAAVEGDVYMSDLRAFRNGFESNYAQLASFVCDGLKNYKPNELNGEEVLTDLGQSGFKLRFRFEETGEWNYRVVVESAGVKYATYASKATVTANADEEKNRGTVRVEQTQKRNFVFEDGTPYVPHGENVAYSVDPTRGSYDYDVFFPKMKEAGMNFCRVWLTYIGHGVQSTEGGILGFDERQDKAAVFDYIVEQAADYGFYLQVPLMTFSRFHSESVSDDVEWRSWDSSPYNVINGGYLTNANEFYTDSRAKEDTKKLYRYYVARWGYSRNILNWEIMNEIGESSDYDETVGKAWAQEIGGYMHSMDPYDHLVSISTDTNFYDEVYSAEAIDFVSIHSYIWGAEYATNGADTTLALWKHFGKPVIIGELGASSVSEETNLLTDPYGLVMRQTAWTAPMSGSAGGGMLFWWKQVNSENFYGNVTPAVNYFKLLPDNFVMMDLLEYGDYSIGHANANVSSKCRALGYISDDAAYVYLYDTRYNYGNTNPGTIEGASMSLQLTDGMYTVQVFDSQTGVVVKTYETTATNGTLTLALDAWACDVAFIIDKK